MDHGLPRADRDLPHERSDERLGLGEFARAQELAHLARERRDGLHAVEQAPSLGQSRPRLGRRPLQALLTLLVLPDTRKDVVHFHVGCLDRLPQPVHPSTNVGQLPFNAI
ncbi:MAG: hypothetical protein OXH97_03345 [Chloroflexota bacterium]|nr:hypothetical protein [Chloroflexota bacterium]MDE2695535.1 hypothetical protein [Chloroflexota bacterium]